MTVTPELLAGVAALGLPGLLLAWLLFRRNGVLFMFVLALLVVGIGYLAMTGAAVDIGARVLDLIDGLRQTTAIDAPRAG